MNDSILCVWRIFYEGESAAHEAYEAVKRLKRTADLRMTVDEPEHISGVESVVSVRADFSGEELDAVLTRTLVPAVAAEQSRCRDRKLEVYEG